MFTIVKCNNAKEFNALMVHIFFTSERVKLDSDEILIHDYETICDHLGITVKDDDQDVDLHQEFLTGNHRYANQSYPVYVEWEFVKWGYDSGANIQLFVVHTEAEISFSSFMQKVEELSKETEELITLLKKIQRIENAQANKRE